MRKVLPLLIAFALLAPSAYSAEGAAEAARVRSEMEKRGIGSTKRIAWDQCGAMGTVGAVLGGTIFSGLLQSKKRALAATVALATLIPTGGCAYGVLNIDERSRELYLADHPLMEEIRRELKIPKGVLETEFRQALIGGATPEEIIAIFAPQADIRRAQVNEHFLNLKNYPSAPLWQNRQDARAAGKSAK